jgi:hypothetical protein
MSVVTHLYFQIVEENNYMFRPFSGLAIIKLRLEYRRKLIYCTTMWILSMGNEISFYNVCGGVWLYIRDVDSAMFSTLSCLL